MDTDSTPPGNPSAACNFPWFPWLLEMSGLTTSAYEAERLHNRGAVCSYRGRSGVHVIKVLARDRLYLHQTAIILLLLS